MRRWELNAIAAAIALSYSVTSLAAEEATAEAEAKQDDTEVITVTGVQYSDHQARLMEREKDQFSTAVSTDDMGNMVDQNVAESLRRLPGVSLQRSEGEGKFVNVRGLGPQFVAVNMNGAEMAGAGEDRKVGLDGIAGDSLGAIEVFKTLTPDMNLNSIGGAVNVKSISAFDRRGDSLKIKLQESYSDLREEFSPKFTIDGTQMFADETLGIGFVVSSESRASLVNEQRHHSTNSYRGMLAWDPLTESTIGDFDTPGDGIMIPYQFENRQEIADRDRDSAGLNVEWRPNDENKFYIKGNYVRFADQDVALREYYKFDTSRNDEEEWVYIDQETKEFVVTDGEVQHQYFIQESEQVVKTFSLGGEHLLGDSWKLAYDYSSSNAREDSVDDRRVQFRVRDVLLWGQATKDELFAEVLTADDVTERYPDVAIEEFGRYGSVDPNNPADWKFDNVLLEDSIRKDNIKTFKADLTYEADSDWLHYVKAGVSASKRTNELDKNRWSYVPSSTGCKDTYESGTAELAACLASFNVSHETLAQSVDLGGLGFSTAVPANSLFTYNFVDQDALEYLIQTVGPTKYAVTGYTGEDDVLSFDSSAYDYTLQEDVQEAYIMGKFELMEDVTLISGVRYVQTEYTSNGNMSLSNDEFAVGEGDGAALDVFVPLPDASIKYSEFFPSAHLRWEYSDEILVRASIWTSYTRPTFKQNRAYAQFKNDITLCATPDDCQDNNDTWGASALEIQDFVLGSNNTLVYGNPNLVPMTSVNYDFSVSWYESEDLFVEWSLFYKDIKNFLVDVNSAQKAITDLEITLPVSQVTEFIIAEDTVLNDVSYTTNGDSAFVYGMELSYNQFFDWGGFIQSNITLQDSEAELDPSVRTDKVPLPDQSDVMANLSVGWENDDISVRLIGNYRSEILEEVGSCPGGSPVGEASISQLNTCKDWTDTYYDDIATLDFKAKWKISKGLSVYFDAINLTENEDLRYYAGNSYTGGNVLSQREAYGKTYQLGVNYKFY